MRCYICDRTPPTATLRYGVADAVGICHHCGIGVCAKHGHKENEPGSPFLCIQCANLDEKTVIARTVNKIVEKTNV